MLNDLTTDLSDDVRRASREDQLIRRFERWERCAIGVFFFLAKLIGLAAILVIEVSMAIRIWKVEIEGYDRVHFDPQSKCIDASNQNP